MNELYPQGAKLLKNAVDKVANSTKIIEKNKELILNFKRNRESMELTELRLVFHMTKLRKFFVHRPTAILKAISCQIN